MSPKQIEMLIKRARTSPDIVAAAFVAYAGLKFDQKLCDALKELIVDCREEGAVLAAHQLGEFDRAEDQIN